MLCARTRPGALRGSNNHRTHSGSCPVRACTGVQAVAEMSVRAAAYGPLNNSKPLFSFGVVSDVQYADIPDGVSFHGVPRFYRNSLVALRRAVTHLQQSGLPFAIHFGDIVDGFQARHGKESSEKALTDVIAAFDVLQGPTYHMLGNHCLYNLTRQRLCERLDIPTTVDGGSYYSFSPHPAWRFIVLDAYDISLLGWPEDHPRHLEADAILKKYNPNKEKNSPEGLVGVARRFVKFGGGVSSTQLEWLEQQIKETESTDQNIIVCSHLPLYPGTCPPACLLWNFQEVLNILQSSDAVVATVAGHSHQNGYLVDKHSIHHLVMPAVLETPPGRDAYGWVEVHQDRVELIGVDTCMSCQLKMQSAAVQRQQRKLLQIAKSEGCSSANVVVLHSNSTPGAAIAAASGADMLVDVADEQQAADKEATAVFHQLAACSVTEK